MEGLELALALALVLLSDGDATPYEEQEAGEAGAVEAIAL